jgi:hypothetical protein
MEHMENAMNHILLDKQDEAVKRFFLSLPADAQGSVVELNGRAVACVVPVSPSPEENGQWTEARNERRCDLIEKEIAGTLTPAEAVELQSLQQAMLKYRNKVAPLPIAAVRKLHDELLAKAGRAHSAK